MNEYSLELFVILLVLNVYVVSKKHWGALYVSLPMLFFVGFSIFLDIIELV